MRASPFEDLYFLLLSLLSDAIVDLADDSLGVESLEDDGGLMDGKPEVSTAGFKPISGYH